MIDRLASRLTTAFRREPLARDRSIPFGAFAGLLAGAAWIYFVASHPFADPAFVRADHVAWVAATAALDALTTWMPPLVLLLALPLATGRRRDRRLAGALGLVLACVQLGAAWGALPPARARAKGIEARVNARWNAAAWAERRRTWGGPDDPETWNGAQVLRALSAGQGPSGEPLSGWQALVAATTAARGAATAACLLAFVACAGSRRLRWPWWTTLPAAAACVPFAAADSVAPVTIGAVVALTLRARWGAPASGPADDRSAVMPRDGGTVLPMLASALVVGAMGAGWVAWRAPRRVLIPIRQHVGEPFADVGLETPDGGRVRSVARGRVNVVLYWDVGCGPCRAAFRELDDYLGEPSHDAVLVLAVNTIDAPEAIRAFASAHSPRIEHARMSDELRGRHPYAGLPTSFVVDSEGRLRDVGLGWGGTSMPRIIEAVTALLAEPARGALGGRDDAAHEP